MKDNRRLGIRLLVAVIYLMITTILFVFGYKSYKDNNTAKKFQEAKSTEEYSYIEVSKMSEKFAYSEKSNVGIHFVVEKEDTGIWHTYLVAINENDIDNYRDLIAYAKGELKTIPSSIKMYGYPVKINDEIKQMAINNIDSFLPASNEVKITNDNYEKYLTNCYLDATIHHQEKISALLIFIGALLIVLICSLILIVLDKDIIVDKIEKSLKKIKKNK